MEQSFNTGLKIYVEIASENEFEVKENWTKYWR